MKKLGDSGSREPSATATLGRTGLLLGTTLALAAVSGACGDGETIAPATGTQTAVTSTASGGGQMASTSTGGAGGQIASTSTGGSGGSGGSGPVACATTAKGATRGSAIALTPNDQRLVNVNRDNGTVTVMAIDKADGQPKMTIVKDANSDDAIAVGAEVWQVAIDGCGKVAYAISRKDQKLVEIIDLDTVPKKGRELAVGSEPTGIAITPNNLTIYVSNWVDGTLTKVDPVTMTVIGTVDLNATLVATGLLGTKYNVQDGNSTKEVSLTARPAMAHPRALAITNNGDASDDDESVLVTEWFGQRTAPESATGNNSDTNKKGLLYKVAVKDDVATTIDLPPVTDTGLNSPVGLKATGTVTGCYPNQVASVSIDAGFAYVSSTCASPVGPTGAFTRGACTTTAFCAAEFGMNSTCTAGFCTNFTCATDADCGIGAPAGACTVATGKCAVNPSNFKTTTHPAVTIVKLADNSATTTVLDKLFIDPMVVGTGATRVPLLQQDIDFRPGFAYTAAEGTDGVFRMTINNGAIAAVGSGQNKSFITLRKNAADSLLRLPIGIAIAKGDAFAYVSNYGSRDVTALSLGAQAIAGDGAADFRITASAALPPGNSDAEAILKGRRFFVTGLGRWSLGGQGWGSCEACHIDGLSDNVTWYFGRGPRQSTSLDGSYASQDATDRRIFNWSAVFDEVADFEGNIRGVSGGVGAIVKTLSTPPANTDRIDTASEAPPQQALQGSSAAIADPNSNTSHPKSLLADWVEIDAYMKAIRSPRKPSNLVAADVTAGKALFASVGQGNCIGCHSGPKWTLSKVFYTPGDLPNAASGVVLSTALEGVTWNSNLNNFPAALFPSTTANSQTMRFGTAPGAEQLQCALRPVGTFGVSPADVNARELRQDMFTAAQGAAVTGLGFNIPSLLGIQVAAPFFHAGNARTLEELLSTTFAAHHKSALASVFTISETQAKQLTAFMLSIDEDSKDSSAVPAKGQNGGSLCFYP